MDTTTITTTAAPAHADAWVRAVHATSAAATTAAAAYAAARAAADDPSTVARAAAADAARTASAAAHDAAAAIRAAAATEPFGVRAVHASARKVLHATVWAAAWAESIAGRTRHPHGGVLAHRRLRVYDRYHYVEHYPDASAYAEALEVAAAATDAVAAWASTPT